MKDKLEPLTLITNVNLGFENPKLYCNYICQICEEQNSEEVLNGYAQNRTICLDCAKKIKKLIKNK